jgi:ferredoxin-like protein FixX
MDNGFFHTSETTFSFKQSIETPAEPNEGKRRNPFFACPATVYSRLKNDDSMLSAKQSIKHSSL